MPPKKTRKQVIKENEALAGRVIMLENKINQLGRVMNGALLAIQVLVEKGILTEQDIVEAAHKQRNDMDREPVDEINPDIIKASK